MFTTTPKTPIMLASSFRMGPLALPNRVVMAPMTRMRASSPGNLPNDLMTRYYTARASAGLIITEGTQISPQGQGYSNTPGIHSEAQVDAWRRVTEAVHNAGGRIFVQLWHVGRVSHAMFHTDGKPVAPSAVATEARVRIIDDQHPCGTMVPATPPRALEQWEIPSIINDYRLASAAAMRADFDGVEIHGAHGYLIDQFLRRPTNLRTDSYGGPLRNRVRFLIEVVEAVTSEIGAERTGLRISPFIKPRGMDDDEVVDAILHVAPSIGALGLAYLHVSEPDYKDSPAIPDHFRKSLRRALHRSAIIVAGSYDKARAERILATGLADLVAFGRPYVANPDLPRRLFHDKPLRNHDPNTLYGGSEQGYIYEPLDDY